MLTDAGANAILQGIVKDRLELRLFQNNREPAEADELANYEEPNFVGYAPIWIPLAAWTIGERRATCEMQRFARAMPGPVVAIFGYLLVLNGVLLDAVRIDAEGWPATPANAGDEIRVSPQLELNRVKSVADDLLK